MSVRRSFLSVRHPSIFISSVCRPLSLSTLFYPTENVLACSKLARQHVQQMKSTAFKRSFSVLYQLLVCYLSGRLILQRNLYLTYMYSALNDWWTDVKRTCVRNTLGCSWSTFIICMLRFTGGQGHPCRSCRRFSVASDWTCLCSTSESWSGDVIDISSHIWFLFFPPLSFGDILKMWLKPVRWNL